MDFSGTSSRKKIVSLQTLAASLPKHVTLTFNLSCNTEAATPLLAAEALRSKLNAISVLWPASPPQPYLQTSHAGTDPTSVAILCHAVLPVTFHQTEVFHISHVLCHSYLFCIAPLTDCANLISWQKLGRSQRAKHFCSLHVESGHFSLQLSAVVLLLHLRRLSGSYGNLKEFSAWELMQSSLRLPLNIEESDVIT